MCPSSSPPPEIATLQVGTHPLSPGDVSSSPLQPTHHKVNDAGNTSSLTSSSVSSIHDQVTGETPKRAGQDSSPSERSLADSQPDPRGEFIFSSPALSELRFSVGSNFDESVASLRDLRDSDPVKEGALVGLLDESYLVLPDDDESRHVKEQNGVDEDSQEDTNGICRDRGTRRDTYDFDRDDAEDVMNMPGKVSPCRPHDQCRTVLGGADSSFKGRRLELELQLEQQLMQH
jgi:hypothetical protein